MAGGMQWRALPMVAALASGCEEPAPVPDERSAYVDLFLEDGLEICAGQMDAYDVFIEHVFDFYAEQSPGDYHVDVHAAEDPDCPRGRSCAKSGSVWLRQDFAQYHELTHTIQSRVDGGSIPSLKEGTAEGLGPAFPISYDVPELTDLQPEFLFAASGNDVSYPHAAAFTRFTVDRWGMATYRAFFRDMGQIEGADEDDYRREFESSFGEPFDDAWSAFRSERRCAYDFPFCDLRSPIELPFELNGIDCGDPETLGYDPTTLDLPPTAVPYRPAKIFHLENPEARTVTFELEYVNIYLGACGDCEQQQQPALVLGSSDNPDLPPINFDLELQPGMTVLFVRSLPGGATRVSITDAN